MAMTIGEANDVARLLHHLDGSHPADPAELVEVSQRLATRAGKPLLMALRLDEARLTATLAAAPAPAPTPTGEGHGTAVLLEELHHANAAAS